MSKSIREQLFSCQFLWVRTFLSLAMILPLLAITLCAEAIAQDAKAELSQLNNSASTGSISGKVTKEDGVTPIEGVSINLQKYNSGEWVNLPGNQSQANGSYCIINIESGDYRVNIFPPYGYGGEYFDNTDDWGAATPVNIQAGQETADINFTLPLGGEIRGYVYESDGVTPLAGESVSMRKTDGSWYGFGARTNPDGSYFIRAAYGGYKVYAGGERSSFMREYYNNKPMFETADTVTVLSGSDPSGINFSLDYGPSILGLVLDKNLNRISQSIVRWNQNDAGSDSYSDVIGKFFFGGLSEGAIGLKARPDVSSGYAWSGYPSYFNTYISGEENIKNHPLFCLDGALVTGFVKDADGHPVASAEYWAGSKNLDVWGRTDSDGRYQIRMPLGKHWINFDEDSLERAALPQEVIITDTAQQITLPNMVLYDSSSGANLSGQIFNNGGFSKAGTFEVCVVDSAMPFDIENFYGLSPVKSLEIESAGLFNFPALPPDATYQVFLVILSYDTFPVYASIRDFVDNVSVPATGVNLIYSSAGGTIEGKVLDIADKPVLAAQVFVLRQSDSRFMGYGETNENGDFKLYNFQPGAYNVIATHPKYANSAPVPITLANGQTITMGNFILTSADELAIRARYAQFASDFAAENLNGAMSVFSDSYLHQGETREYTRNNFTELFNNCYGLTAQFDIKSIDVVGDRALAKADSIMRGRQNADDRPYLGIGKDELNYFRKEGGVWKIYGDQELFSYRAQVGYHPQYAPDSYHIDFMMDSKAVTIASVKVSGTDIGELNLANSGDGWRVSYHYVPPKEPVVGTVYTFTITDSSSNVYTCAFAIKNIAKRAAVPTLPVGGASVNGRPKFEWQPSPIAYGYGVQVFKGGWPNTIWSNFSIYGRNTAECLFDGNGEASEQLENGQTYSWRVYAYDQDHNIAEAPTETFTYYNRAPVLDPIGSKAVNENEKLEFVISGSDPDGDPLEYSASNVPSWATFDAKTRTFSGTPNFMQAGSYTVTFKVADGNMSDSKNATITVNNVLAFGTVSEVPARSTLLLPIEGATIAVWKIIPVQEPVNPPISAVTNAQGKFALVGTIATGNYKLQVSKKDYKTSGGIVTLKNTQATPCMPMLLYSPEFDSVVSNVSVNEGQKATLNISATDKNAGDTLKFTAANLPAGATLVDNGNKTAALSWTPDYSQAGSYHAALKVTDSLLEDAKTVNISVANVPIADLSADNLYSLTILQKFGLPSFFIAQMSNKGDKNSGPYTLVWKVDGQTVCTKRVSSALAGKAMLELFDCRLTKGTHSVSITLDSANQIPESNEGNNTKEIQVVVR